MAAVATASSGARLTCRFFDKLGSAQLVEIQERVQVVLEDRSRQLGLFTPAPQLVPPSVQLLPAAAPQPQLGQVLSPTQVRTFLDCSARWWFKYGLGLPETKNSSLALGCAVHRALEANFREKMDTREDLPTLGVVALFRQAWQEQAEQTEFRADEDPAEIAAAGVQLVVKYMDEAARHIQPAAVELDVRGAISGVEVRGKVDLLDDEGRVVDVKTAARKPSGIAPDYAFQLATYRQLAPGASGEARLDTLVRTKTVQLVQQAYTVGEQDIRATEVLYPLVRDGIRSRLYFPHRQAIMCSRRHCPFWQHCEREFGGTVAEA